MNKIQVIIKQPNNLPVIKSIDNTLDTLKSTVAGYIEIIPFPFIPNTVLICNEEGKLKNLLPNIYIPHWNDVIAGAYIIASRDGEDIASLSHEQVIKAYLYSVLLDYQNIG